MKTGKKGKRRTGKTDRLLQKNGDSRGVEAQEVVVSSGRNRFGASQRVRKRVFAEQKRQNSPAGEPRVSGKAESSGSLLAIPASVAITIHQYSICSQRTSFQVGFVSKRPFAQSSNMFFR